MAFWLERILSSKRLVCNRMQTGPISSLPSSFLVAVVQMSEKQTSQLCAIQGCRCATGKHLLASTESGAVPGSENRFIRSRNVDQSSETWSRFERIFRGQLLFLSLGEYPHFYSLALPDSNPECASLTQVLRQLPPRGSAGGSFLIKMVELWGLSWGKASLQAHLFILLLFLLQGNSIQLLFSSSYLNAQIYILPISYHLQKEGFRGSMDNEGKSSVQKQHVFQFTLLKTSTFQELWVFKGIRLYDTSVRLPQNLSEIPIRVGLRQ